MTEGGRRCANCGAVPTRGAANFCDSCGAELPRDGAPPPPTPFVDTEERFRLLAEHEDYERLMSLEADVPSERSVHLLQLLAGVTLLGTVGLLIAGFTAAFFAPLAVALVVGLGILLFSLVDAVTRRQRYAKAPLQRLPALVLEEHTRFTGGGREEVSTQYTTTLLLQDGKRLEVRTVKEVVGRVTRGDIGVAYLKGGLLIEFGRVAV